MPEEIQVDGMESNGVQLWGWATRQPDGTYRCYANVDGALCIVEVKITLPPIQLSLFNSQAAP